MDTETDSGTQLIITHGLITVISKIIITITEIMAITLTMIIILTTRAKHNEGTHIPGVETTMEMAMVTAIMVGTAVMSEDEGKAVDAPMETEQQTSRQADHAFIEQT